SGTHRLTSIHLYSSGFDGEYDILVAGAAAEIAFQPVTDFFFGGIRIVLDEGNRRHDHTGGAVATLQAVFFPEGFLHGMELSVGRQSFDGRDFAPVCLHRQTGTGFDRATIQMYGTSPTLAGITADVGAG